jgi:NAD(P)-dependent dehydrogenase (short-subunit alcohol dehydrogenase family)
MTERSSINKAFSFDLSNRTVLLTGASAGIGRHFARILAASGANLVLGARRKDLLDTLKSEVEALGGKAIAVALDVSDERSTIAAYDAAEATFGGVDSVIANAGVSGARSALGVPVEDFDQVVAVNLRGVFLTVREGARRMVAAGAPERGHGRIVIISSITAHHVVDHGVAAYSATKAAVTQMGRVLALEWANKGINVNVVCPGYMRTDLTDALWELDVGKRLLNSFPRRRIMSIDALDPILLYLCADACAQVTGSVFTVDDGQTI